MTEIVARAWQGEGLFDFRLSRVEKAPTREGGGWLLKFTCGCGIQYAHEVVLGFVPGPACRFDVKLSQTQRKKV